MFRKFGATSNSKRKSRFTVFRRSWSIAGKLFLRLFQTIAEVFWLFRCLIYVNLCGIRVILLDLFSVVATFALLYYSLMFVAEAGVTLFDAHLVLNRWALGKVGVVLLAALMVKHR